MELGVVLFMLNSYSATRGRIRDLRLQNLAGLQALLSIPEFHEVRLAIIAVTGLVSLNLA